MLEILVKSGNFVSLSDDGARTHTHTHRSAQFAIGCAPLIP
jgi:hypothetical protein